MADRGDGASSPSPAPSLPELCSEAGQSQRVAVMQSLMVWYLSHPLAVIGTAAVGGVSLLWLAWHAEVYDMPTVHERRCGVPEVHGEHFYNSMLWGRSWCDGGSDYVDAYIDAYIEDGDPQTVLSELGAYLDEVDIPQSESERWMRDWPTNG